MKKKNNKNQFSLLKKISPQFLLLAIVFVGSLLRLIVATRGYNFDMQSYQIVAHIVSKGGNVYAETTRYNYGPIWFNVLYLFDIVSRVLPNHYLFRYIIASFLTLVDIGIFFVLLKKFGKFPAILFFLNPISIVITGYHSQFDNFAILIAMLAVLTFGEDEKTLTKRKLGGIVLLGTSLMIKHIFFMFPLWLAMKQKGLLQKVVVAFVPIILFLGSFIPYLHDGKYGIMDNVFLYKSFNNHPFLSVFAPQIVMHIPSLMIFVVLLILCGFLLRTFDTLRLLLLYTLCMVIFSPAIANQYLAIAVPAIAVFWNSIFLIYTLIVSYYFVVDYNELHFPLPLLKSPIAYQLAVLLLFIGFILVPWERTVTSMGRELIKYVKREISFQLE